MHQKNYTLKKCIKNALNRRKSQWLIHSNHWDYYLYKAVNQVYTPGSVFDSHLSRPIVTYKALATYLRRDEQPHMSLSGLAPGGVYMAFQVTLETVSSYLTFPPFPIACNRWFISVALSLESPPLGVTQHLCSVEPGRSSSATFRYLQTRPSDLLNNLITLP